MFLDGVRGIAALYVVLLHAAQTVESNFQPLPLRPLGAWIRAPLMFGHVAVSVFIVLSGYCLMLPIAQDPSLNMRGGVSRYLMRRAKRILPPYYAALALCLLLIAMVPSLNRPGESTWSVALPAFTPGALISHLTMTHYFSREWASKIDPPMWSVAPEWYIYLLFPFVLLPIWRRAGMVAALGFAACMSLGPQLLIGRAILHLHLWYALLFTVGAAGTMVTFAPLHSRLRAMCWGAIAAILGIAAAGLVCFRNDWCLGHPYVSDLLVGGFAAALIVHCAKDRDARITRFLGSWPLAWLGGISYSLYLIHNPLVAMFSAGLVSIGLGNDARFFAVVLLGSGVSILAAYLFHLTFERPFMASRPLRSGEVLAAAVASPAP